MFGGWLVPLPHPPPLPPSAPPSINSRWFRANGHTSSPPAPLFTSTFPSLPKLYQTGEWTSLFLPPSLPPFLLHLLLLLLLLFLTAVSPPLCLLRPNTPLPQRENGYYLYSLVPLRASFQFSTLFTNAKRSSEPGLQSPPWPGATPSAEPGPPARPDHKPWPASVTKRVNTGDLRLGRGWSRSLLWDRFLELLTV